MYKKGQMDSSKKKNTDFRIIMLPERLNETM
jgi:hypothetical protein